MGMIYVLIAICAIAIVGLIAVMLIVWFQNRNKSIEIENVKNKSTGSSAKIQGIESMNKFLDFNEIVDSMIVRKNRQQYLMVIQCKGVNYDLLGSEEKIAVENGFIQFLNTLRFPVQLYIQTRSLNLKDSVDQYTEKMDEIKEQILKLDAQIKKEKANGNPELVRKIEFDRRRKLNILEYGTDITDYIARMSQNRNVLQQNTYVVVAYYTSEFGGEIANYSKEEVDNIAFSELYTRAQTLIRSLASSGVTGRVINSEELAELLYIAYNREDSELINIRRSVDAQYDSLYNTAKDILDKQKEIIEQKVEEEALNLAAKSITKADKIRRVRQDRQEEIKRKALNYVEEYKDEMAEDLYNETRRQIEKADLSEDGEKKQAKSLETDGQGTRKVLSEEEKLRRRKALARKKAMARREQVNQEGKPKMVKKRVKPAESEV